MNKRPRLPALLLLACLIFNPALTRAHVPVPDSVLNPRTPSEAWNVLRLATTNIDQLLREDRLDEVPDQASLCSPALRALATMADPPARRRQAAASCVRAQTAIGSLAQACAVRDKASALAASANLTMDLHELAAFFDAGTVRADIFYCPMHPDVLSAKAGAFCDKCGMPLVPRRIPYSFVYVPPGEPSVRLTLKTASPLEAGREAKVTVRMTFADGKPVLVSDLMVTHTQPIHLLIVDSALEDYHHIHPIPTGTPGEYAFVFTPAKSTGYRVFADLLPTATGIQEYPYADFAGGAAPTRSPDPSLGMPDSLTSQAGGFKFQLTFTDLNGAPLRAREARSLRITVSDAAGRPVGNLEPVMNAFAHLVGFYADRRTVLHLHPAGGEIVDQALRGGPSLDFRCYPPKPGFLRLYCQVHIAGRDIFAPFDVNVLP